MSMPGQFQVMGCLEKLQVDSRGNFFATFDYVGKEKYKIPNDAQVKQQICNLMHLQMEANQKLFLMISYSDNGEYIWHNAP